MDVTEYIYNNISKADSDIAKVFDMIYHDVCVFDGNNWYYFANHRWNNTPKGLYITGLFSTELVVVYNEVIDMVRNEMIGERDPKILEKIQSKIILLLDIIFMLKTTRKKNGILTACTEYMYDDKFLSKLDDKNYLLGFENGIYDFETMEFRDGRPDDYVLKSTKYDYVKFDDDDSVIFDIFKYLTNTFPIKKEEGEAYSLLDAVLMIYSSILVGGNTEQLFYIQSNKGCNGKSLLVNLLDATLGEYSTTIRPTFFCDETKQSSSAASPELACLLGVRLIHCEEPNEGDMLNVGRLKEVTGNSEISCRPLYTKCFTYQPQFKCIFSCNKKPTFRNVNKDDTAIWRRIRNIPFVSTFVDKNESVDLENYKFLKDSSITETIKNNIKWRQAFMCILIEYYRDYKKHGIIVLNSMKMLDDQYKAESEPLYDFFNDYIEETNDPKNEGLTLSNIFHSYRRSAYFRKNILMKDVRKYLESKDYPYGQGTINGKHQRYIWKTLKWINDMNETEIEETF